MTKLEGLFRALDECRIAQEVGLLHDETRMQYRVTRNTVQSFEEYEHILGDYYEYHYTTCVTRGGSLQKADARSAAKQIVERQYHQHQGDIVSAFQDARDGTDGGLKLQLDMIAETLKAEAVEWYVRDVFDRYITPSSREEKIEMIGEFLRRFSIALPSSIDPDHPEDHAHKTQELIRAFVKSLQKTWSIIRRA